MRCCEFLARTNEPPAHSHHQKHNTPRSKARLQQQGRPRVPGELQQRVHGAFVVEVRSEVHRGVARAQVRQEGREEGAVCPRVGVG